MNNGSFIDDGTKTSERNTVKQFAEPEAEDKGEEMRNSNLEQIQESRHISDSNEETSRSNNNNERISQFKSTKRRNEAFTQTSDNI